MRAGKYKDGEVCLRLKIKYDHPNMTLRDPVAYRVRHISHPHVGDKWCIYPLYDFTHCLCDSIEDIDYSLCTLEFEIRRELYYWVLENCEVYRPFQWYFIIIVK
jgi:glutaminyl-tRNA synthetase